jgi:hypothetical protein
MIGEVVNGWMPEVAGLYIGCRAAADRDWTKSGNPQEYSAGGEGIGAGGGEMEGLAELRQKVIQLC